MVIGYIVTLEVDCCDVWQHELDDLQSSLDAAERVKPVLSCIFADSDDCGEIDVPANINLCLCELLIHIHAQAGIRCNSLQASFE